MLFAFDRCTRVTKPFSTMKLLVGSLALLCFATIDAAVFSSDLRIERAPRAKHAISAGTRRLHRADRLKSGSQPITDFLLNDDVLLTEVSLGTPGKQSKWT